MIIFGFVEFVCDVHIWVCCGFVCDVNIWVCCGVCLADIFGFLLCLFHGTRLFLLTKIPITQKKHFVSNKKRLLLLSFGVVDLLVVRTYPFSTTLVTKTKSSFLWVFCHLYILFGPFCGPRPIHICDMTHSYVK